jgi:hypothetical protein
MVVFTWKVVACSDSFGSSFGQMQRVCRKPAIEQSRQELNFKIMKKIGKFVKIFVVITTIFFSTRTIAQVSPQNGLFQCEYYPTSDATLNSMVSDLIAQSDEFDGKMGSIYGNLSESEKQQVDVYIRNNDEGLFTAFPQFNDDELKNDVTLIKEKHAIVVNKHTELYPQLSGGQRDEAIRNIIKCANSKAKVVREGSWLERAIDPCEIERRNCIASVAAQAAFMHLTCATLDLTFFAGIICHATAFIYQATAGNNCNIAGQRCRESQHNQ